MDVLILQVFVSLLLVASSLVLFAWSARQRDHEHVDRTSLLPLEDDPIDPGAPASELPASAPSAQAHNPRNER